MIDITRVRSYMHDKSIDAWLVYDFRGSNPVMWQLLGGTASTTRRSFLFIPCDGTPKILAQTLDRNEFAHASFSLELFTTWVDMLAWLKETLRKYTRIAMEYSPGANLPTMSWVDGGTLDVIRSLGVEVVSSADIFQLACAAWPELAIDSHMQACSEVNRIKDAAFDYIRHAVRNNVPITEYSVQEFIMQEFQKSGLETEDRPIVSVNANSGNPHYEPSVELHQPIRNNDWVLIDLWARYPGYQNVFADITWVGYVGEEIPSMYQTIFDIVKTARDKAVNRLKEAWNKKETMQGWELDDITRDSITDAGYGQYFVHRTGHSIGPGAFLHALGVNIDNLETHDTRTILPGIGFSIEPGIYLPDIGVRLEINVYIDQAKGPTVTTPLQDQIIKLV